MIMGLLTETKGELVEGKVALQALKMKWVEDESLFH